MIATDSHVQPYRNKRPTSRTAYIFITVLFGRKSIAFVRHIACCISKEKLLTATWHLVLSPIKDRHTLKHSLSKPCFEQLWKMTRSQKKTRGTRLNNINYRSFLILCFGSRRPAQPDWRRRETHTHSGDRLSFETALSMTANVLG